MTSVYGIMFLILGNISGNAIAFAIYVLIAAGRDPIYDQSNNYEKKPVIGLAIGVLTFCAAIHVFTRRGGIFINNTFAVLKISMVLMLSILGFVHWGKRYLHSSGINESPIYNATLAASLHIPNITSSGINNAPWTNLDIHTSFRGGSSSVANYVDSFLFVLFSYTGFEQPFYVLSEVARPRKVFPTYTILGMVLTTILYTLVNVSYFCVVPKEAYMSGNNNSIDMAGSFMHYLFDSSMGPQTARRVMAGLTAMSTFGNIIVMTFTSARVKQEIAKEGILPYSLYFATGHTTPWAKLQAWWRRDTTSTSNHQSSGIDLENHLEQTPMAALALHWFTSVLLIAVTSMLKPVTAYAFLVSLYSYVNCAVVGFLVSGGLIYLKLDSYFRGERGRNWANLADFVPWLSPLHAVIYFAATGFFLFATFTPPPLNSTYAKAVQTYQWYLLPTIGLSSLIWGVFWWLGIRWLEYIRRRVFFVVRTAYVEEDADKNYVQKAEIVEHWWQPNVQPDRRVVYTGDYNT
jgi:amino acid transporter